MKKSLYILLSFYIAFTSCKKTTLPPENEDTPVTPVFYAKGTIDGAPLSLEAGADGYYMSSSYALDANSVYVYRADLQQKDCDSSSNNCGVRLSLLINDSRISTQGAAMNADATLRTGTYVFDNSHPEPQQYTAKFTPVDPFTTNASYKWEFSDGTTQSGYEVTRVMDAHKTYSAKYIFSSPCDANHTNVFNIGNSLQTVVNVERDMSQAAILNYKFSATPTGQGPYKYLWDFGDNSAVSNEANPTHTYQRTGKMTAVLNLVDANGDTCVSKYQVAAFFEKNCSANYTAKFTPINVPVLFSAITVLVRDANGVTYSSKDLVQPTGSKFEVVSVEDYKTNAAGERTKKLSVKFSCVLQNGNRLIHVNNAEAVFAVAFK